MLRPLLFRLYDDIRRGSPQHLLTLTQGSVLRTLVTEGPRRMSALAEAERVRLPSMSDVIARMRRLGLVERAPDPDDGRATVVTATEEGRRFFARLTSERAAHLRARLEHLSDADRAAIAAALPALNRLLATPSPAASQPETPEPPAAAPTREGATDPA